MTAVIFTTCSTLHCNVHFICLPCSSERHAGGPCVLLTSLPITPGIVLGARHTIQVLVQRMVTNWRQACEKWQKLHCLGHQRHLLDTKGYGRNPVWTRPCLLTSIYCAILSTSHHHRSLDYRSSLLSIFRFLFSPLTSSNQSEPLTWQNQVNPPAQILPNGPITDGLTPRTFQYAGMIWPLVTPLISFPTDHSLAHSTPTTIFPEHTPRTLLPQGLFPCRTFFTWYPRGPSFHSDSAEISP